jgi:molybdate transport system substrate-binding protein
MRRIPFVIFLVIMSLQSSRAQERILIAAASDLKFALDSLVHAFSETHDGKIAVTYGSSGKLTEQIMNGAPFSIFFSADRVYPERLENGKKTSSDIYDYAIGRIVIWSKKVDPTKNEINSLLDPGVKKIAIANPMHAPYGKRAIETLEYYELSEAIKSNLVYGENISQAAQFASTGAADVGIIALSLALSPNMKNETGKYFLIPEESHQPLVQAAVITTHGKGNRLAAAFFEYIKSEEAVDVLRRFGFSRP